jgi:replicative DNA helicase
MITNTDLLFDKGLPANLDAERFVLGSILIRDAAYLRAAPVLQPEDFSLEKHRRIYVRMGELSERGVRIDRVTLADELDKHGQLQSVDGLAYLVSLDHGLPEIVNLDAYVNIVRDKSTLRKAIFAHRTAIEECLAAADPTPEILNRAERSIAALATETRAVSFRTPMEVINEAGGITSLVHSDRRGWIETPWPGLNRMLVGRGFMPGQMVVIGARPSRGKTALGCQIADYAASHGTGAAVFTLEMPARDIMLRMAAARAQVDSLKVTQGWANQLEINALNEAFADLTDEEHCRLWIDDTTGCTVPAMRAALRRLAARHPISLVVIDYLQLVETSGGSERRYEQVTEISRGVKRLAREFNAPVVVLAQLNRESEKDGNRKPHPSQLRDSGSIEQDADVILMPALQDGQDEQGDVLAIDLMIMKQRNGPAPVRVPLQFLKRYAKFIEAGSQTEARVA